MDKKQKVRLLLSEYKKLCDKIDEDYKRIIKSNNSAKIVLAEITELLSDYDRELTKLLISSRQYKINTDEITKGIGLHKRKFLLLSEQLQKIENSSCQKCKKKITTDNCHIYLWNREQKELKKWSKDEVTKFSFEDWERAVPLFCSESCFKQSYHNLKPNNNKNDFPKKKKENYICWECHKTKSEKWFINKNTGLEFCSRECDLNHNAELCENCVQKCLKYENGTATDYQTYYRDNEKKTGTLCFDCKQKQKKELEEELKRLQEDQEADKKEMERLRSLIENSNNPNIERERERERESKIFLSKSNYARKYSN